MICYMGHGLLTINRRLKLLEGLTDIWVEGKRGMEGVACFFFEQKASNLHRMAQGISV